MNFWSFMVQNRDEVAQLTLEHLDRRNIHNVFGRNWGPAWDSYYAQTEIAQSRDYHRQYYSDYSESGSFRVSLAYTLDRRPCRTPCGPRIDSLRPLAAD